MLGYAYMAVVLWRLGRYEDMLRYLDEGSEYGADHDFLMYEQTREAYRYRLLAMRGEWEAAEQGLRELLGADPANPGVSAVTSCRPRPTRARARAGTMPRNSSPRPGDMPTVRRPRAGAHGARRVGLAAGRSARKPYGRGLQPPPARVRRGRGRAAALPGARGMPGGPFHGCPEECAAGLRGDWRAAAAVGRHRGSVREGLRVAGSGELGADVEAISCSTSWARGPAALSPAGDSGAGGAAGAAGAAAATRANPAG